MAKDAPLVGAADKRFLDAWDAEVDAEEAEDRALQKEALADQISARARTRADWAPLRAKLLQQIGITDAEARKRADEAFARSRKTGAEQRKRALEVVKKRAQANAAEGMKMAAGVKRGQ